MKGPWTPIVLNAQDNYVKARVWGREYLYDHAVLPVSIKSGEEELLNGPIALNAYFDGKKAGWTDFFTVVQEQDEEHISFSVAARAQEENVILNARVRLDADGFIWTDLALIPFWEFSKGNGKFPRLDGLTVEIPLKSELMELYHFWPGGDTGLIAAKTVRNSGALQEESMKLPFKPLLWLGTEKTGLCWICESEENIQVSNPEQMISVEQKGNTTWVKITLLDTMPQAWHGRVDRWIKALPPVHFGFGLQATPVKPFEKYIDHDKTVQFRWKKLMEYNDGDWHKTLDQLAAAGVKRFALHEDWTIIQNYGQPEDEELFKQLVQACHDRKIRVMVYFGYEYSTLAPDWFEKQDAYLARTPEGDPIGGWQRQPWQRDYIVCYKGGYSDVMIERVKHVMDDYGVDDIYTDGTYIPWECANELHGCGYRDRDGRLHHTYPIRAVRNHVKCLYETVHERGGYVDAHQSSCCMTPTLAYCDSYLDGEHIQSVFQEDLNGYFSMGTVRSEFSGYNFGIPAQFIIYSKAGATYTNCCGTMLLNGVFSRPWISMQEKGWEDLDQAAGIWKIWDAFGMEDTMFVPFWKEGCPVSVLEDGMQSVGVKASTWMTKTNGREERARYLAVVFSAYKEARTVTVTVPEGVCKAQLKYMDGQRQDAVIENHKIVMDMMPLTPVFVEFE